MGSDAKADWGSREQVMDLPHLMTLLAYLSRHHDVPSYGWNVDGLRYHYTDAPGLLGILDSNTLWATDIRHLNDPSEGSYAVNKITKPLSNSGHGATKSFPTFL